VGAKSGLVIRYIILFSGIFGRYLHKFTVKGLGGSTMPKVSRRTKNCPQTPRTINMPLAIFKGVAVSIAVSLICAIGLSVVSLISDNKFIDMYLEYIMVAVTMTSIFTGSIYAAKQIGAKGLLIGCTVGIIYVLFSVGVGMELGQAQLSWLMLGNKFAAGSLAGALGGFIGVNL